jgi:hypothetical protein
MQLANQHILRIAAMLALAAASTAASTSAFAQSAEYRRGYDDGYAAGLRAARDDRGRGPRWGRLHVEEAAYGARGAMCDARQAVRQEAERNGGLVVAGNHLCGDPARNVQKRLTVVYRCGGDEPIRVTGRENETLRLECQR